MKVNRPGAVTQMAGQNVVMGIGAGSALNTPLNWTLSTAVYGFGIEIVVIVVVSVDNC